MAVNNTLLIISPLMRQYFTDPDTLLPVVGTVTFYKTDKITLKNIFQQTGNPNDPFQVAPNPVTLDTAGAIPFLHYVYPYDEDDETTEELYYVEIRRDDNSLVFALDNFPENFVSGGADSGSTSLANRCPSYGFDNPVFANIYTESNENPIRDNWSNDIGQGVRPATGWTWILSDISDLSDFFYEAIAIPTGQITGNPIYLMNFKATSIVTQTRNDIRFRLCAANELEGQTINYNIFMQDNLSLLSSLPVYVESKTSGDLIQVGSFDIDASLSLRELSFTMPTLTVDSSIPNDPTYLLIRMPLNSTFDISMTATYCYIGDPASISRLPVPYGQSQVKQLFSELSGLLTNTDNNYLISDIPLVYKKGRLGAIQQTGRLFTASADINPELGDANRLDDTTLVRGDNLGNTLADRFLDISGLSPFGGNTFVFSSVIASAFDIETQVSSPSFSTWTSSNGDITIAEVSNPATPLSSVVDAGLARRLIVTFNNNFNANSQQNWDIKSTNDRSKFARGSGYVSNVINNVVGNYTQATTSIPSVVDFNVSSDVTIVTTDPGSGGSPAICTIEFAASGFTSPNLIFSKTNTISIPNTAYFLELYENYFAFNDQTYATTPLSPPYVLSFLVDGEGEQNVSSSIKTYVTNFDGSQINDGDYLAFALNETINGGEIYTITIVNVPTNGHLLSISTSNKTINLVYYDIAETKPNKPDENISTIFIEYEQTDTTDQVKQKTIDAIAQNTGSIPRSDDLNLASLSSELDYYVYI